MSKFQDEVAYSDEPNLQTNETPGFHDVTLGVDGGGGRTNYTDKHAENNTKKWYKKPVIWGSAALCLVLIGVVGTVVALAGGGESSTLKVGVQLPGPDLNDAATATNREIFSSVLMTRYNAKGMDWSPVSEPESFQARALEFISGSVLFSELSESQNVERYAAIVFYLSTFRQPHLLNAVAEAWTRSDGWSSNQNLCSWEGVQCDANDKVVSLILSDNKLSGTVPVELGLFDDFAKLDFSSNVIYMDNTNHMVWNHLPNLQELVMDDNYVLSETGIPSEFGSLTSIEKISLSFNLLQGTFDTAVFSSMPTLIHFEAESNYIRGALPESLLQMPNLTYLYVRRNSLAMPLTEILVPGYLPSLFALWLDGNDITGDIPAEIGQFTALASLSVTEAGLTGPLPAEMGLLTDLQRLWLYNNDLTGPISAEISQSWTKLEVFEVYGNQFVGIMPSTICTAVQTSEYAFATLTADCQEIQCELDTCCTRCY